MTTEKLIELFEKAAEGPDAEVPADIRIASRNDINALILLDKLLPRAPTVCESHVYYGDMISCAEHDEVWLEVDIEELAKVITEPQVAILSALGVSLDTSTDSLRLFV